MLSTHVVWADSLWPADATRSWVADRKAHAIGDILTVLVQESSTATKDNSTKTGKKSGVDAALQTFLYSPAASGFLTKGGTLPALKFNSTHTFDGGGAIENKEQIIARIPVRVVDVLPNNNLVIEGTRQTAFGGERQEIVLRGVVRSEDIAANNTVFSYHIADATIHIINKGTVSDSQRKGWFTKLWEVITPF
ncbi:MAG: flagellar basal body L-ring protein FlgH [Verrucomicrobiae bacterium]|nr:flagellar basal body L-ring protein FlgH [Verrucomicrobiae bacterium]